MKNKSIAFKLRQEGKSNLQFEHQVNNLTIEELLTLKLELSAKYVFGGKFYLFSLWDSLEDILRDTLFKFAETISENENQARMLLGMRYKKYKKYKKLYGFKDDVEDV